MIDIIELLREKEIQYWTHGKNCSAGWVNIRCPLPDCDDRTNHCGIELKSGNYHCWKCGEKGRLFYLLLEMGVDRREARELFSRFRTETPSMVRPRPEENVDPAPPGRVLRPEFTRVLSTAEKAYLLLRKFDPDFIRKHYFVRGGSITGPFKFRIVVPVIKEGKVVNFTGMAISGQEPKYKHCPDSQALVNMKSWLYNFDRVKDTVVVMEGVTDVWRFGDGAVATFGTAFTDAQVKVMLDRRIKRAFVMFDADAIAKGRKFAEQISPFIPEVEVLELATGDPGDLRDDEVWRIRKWIKI